jgi:hypothetical protein
MISKDKNKIIHNKEIKITQKNTDMNLNSNKIITETQLIIKTLIE